MLITKNNVELLEIGEIKLSKSWTNLYFKFKLETGEELWFYYSEHIDKPHRLKQIKDFVYPAKYPVGTIMTVNYKIIQSPNKSTKLSIVSISNCRNKN